MNTKLHPLWFPILSLLAVYLAANMLLNFLLAPLGGLYDPAFFSFLTYAGSFVVTIGYAVALRAGWDVEIPSFHPEKWRANPRLIVVGVILMLAAGIVLSPVLERMPAEHMDTLNHYMQGGFWPMFTAVVAAPLLEEFLFRGIIQKNLVRRLGPVLGIVLGSLIFGAMHLVPQQIVYASGLGMILGSIYWLTGSLNSSIAVHFVNNGLTYLLYMVFGSSVGIEHKLLGSGSLWSWSYALSAAVLLTGLWYILRRVRRQKKGVAATPNSGNSIEN